MRSRPYYQQQQFNPARKPFWRWDRANNLVNEGRYFSQRRDDRATGIIVSYIRETARCLSRLRLKRVRERFQHVAQAHEMWQSARTARLELECRILARQTDVAIGLEMDLPASTVQAYRDIFYHLDDRIDAGAYIMFQVVRVRPQQTANPQQLMRMCAYRHGPSVIRPWLRYLRGDHATSDLPSDVGCSIEQIGLLLGVHSLPDTPKMQRSLAKLSPILFEIDGNSPQLGNVVGAFADSTARIMAGLDFRTSTLPILSYAPARPRQRSASIHATKREARRAA